MSAEFAAVCEFMEMAGQAVNHNPIDLSTNTAVITLRRALIVEEVKELAEALSENDNIEIVDALIDILYVTWGAYAALGLKHSFVHLELNPNTFINDLLVLSDIQGNQTTISSALDSIISLIGQYCDKFHVDRAGCFKAVHDNNMTKFCDSIEEAELTVAKYKGKSKCFQQDTPRYDEVSYVKKNNKYVVMDGTGKVLKSINYQPVVLRNVIKFC